MRLLNKVYSALNLNFLACCASGEIILSSDLILWPDGLMSKLILPGVKKFPGRDFLFKIMNSLTKENSICIIGTCNDKNKSWLEVFNINTSFYDPGFINSQSIIDVTEVPDVDIYIIAISTPKQEMFAHRLFELRNKPIVCIGGALNMLSGNEVIVPDFLFKNNLEWLWRIYVGGWKTILRDLLIIFKIASNPISFVKKIIFLKHQNNYVKF